MTIPTPNENYSIATGSSSTNVFIPFLSTENPTSQDYKFPLYKRWINSTSGAEFILVSLNQSNGILTANWLQLGSNLDDLTVDGDIGSASPSNGTLNLITGNSTLNSGSSVLFSASGSTITLNVTDSNLNTFVGNNSGNNSTVGIANCGLGYSTLHSLTIGLDNCAVGYACMNALTEGQRNCGYGHLSLNNILTGSFNVASGDFSGTNYTGSESSNVLLNSKGVVGESNVVRIGDSTGAGNQQLNKAFISGINGVTSSNAKLVTINSVTDQLGVISVPITVPNGGTGDTSFTPYAPLVGGTTSTGALQQATTGFSSAGFVLTSNGSSSLPTFQANSTFASIVVQTFTGSGTYTPTSGMSYCTVLMVGGGGGGGSTLSTTGFDISAGAGGGSGEGAYGVFSAVQIGASQVVTIGAGGAAGTAGGGGGMGGTTSLGSLMTAVGGGGGVQGDVNTVSTSNGGVGGIGGTGGSIHFQGNAGSCSCGFSNGVSASMIVAGSGAPSIFGGSPGSVASITSGQTVGRTGVSYGSGGGGGVTSQTGSAVNGGAGAIGVVIITEYIA